MTPLVPAPRLADELGIGELWLKLDTANPTHSFKDRVVAVASRKAQELGLTTLSCSSTGNLADAVAARAAAEGLEAAVFVPRDLEPEKLAAAAVYGPRIYAVDGTYDHCSRLSVELSFELPWGFVNVNLRSYYAEGSKTLAYEIAEQLGWETPDAVAIPIASGALYHKVGQGFAELRTLGLVEGESPALFGGQAEGCEPVATAFREGARVVPVRPASIARSLAIGNPADGDFAIATARSTGGAIYAVRRRRDRRQHGGVGGDDRCLRRDRERSHARRSEGGGGRGARGARIARRASRHGRRVEDARACLAHLRSNHDRGRRRRVRGASARRLMAGRSLFDKVWDRHVVLDEPGQPTLLYIDLHLVHEVTSPQAFEGLRLAGRQVRRPELTVATMDHNVPTLPGPVTDPLAKAQLDALQANCAEFGIELHGTGSGLEGIVHVIGPELGLTQPGKTIVCGDSHTSTHGAFGALAFGIGTSEVEHVLATQTLNQRRPKTMLLEFVGTLPPGLTAKDMILGAIGQVGVAGGVGYVVEYAGEAIRALSMEQRLTVCNMTIEWGARAGMIAPDETTFTYLEGRRHAPAGEDWDRAVADWLSLCSDPDAAYDTHVVVDVAELVPQVTWGTNPGMVVPVTGAVPDPATFADPDDRVAGARALEYMGLRPGQPIEEIRDRPCLHRLLHELADRGSPRRGGDRRRTRRRPRE